jgi:hypothetical protein
MNHYKFLEANIETFFKSVGLDKHQHIGLIVAAGDKCYGYKSKWETAGIPFEHGVMLYLLTYTNLYEKEVRETSDGWVDVSKWVIDNYMRFKPHLDLL